MSITAEIQQYQDETREGWMPEKKDDPAAKIQAMREAIREAHGAICDLRLHVSEDCDQSLANLAIAKLQPFLKP